MGCKSNLNDSSMPRRNSQERDNVTEGSNHHNSSQTSINISNTANGTSTLHAQTGSRANNCPSSPTNVNIIPSSPQGQGALAHSSTDPNLRGGRPHSAHHHRTIGHILRIMGDSYCYSCGIALRQMGDQLSGEYEVRRALSTGDLPNSVKNT